MIEQTAATVERTAQFPASLRLGSADVRGMFSADGSYNYQFDGPILRAYSSSGPSVSQFNFTKLASSSTLLHDAVLDTPPSILCVCPFNRVNVLVGLEDCQGQGLLCLLNIVSGMVLRAVTLSHGVTVLAAIHADSACEDLPYIGEELQNFSGIVACGTKQGHVLILDLILDMDVSKTSPLKVHIVDVNGSQSAPDRKQLLANEHKAVAYSLACLDNPEYFTYVSAAQKVLHYANHDDVYISSLKFLPNMATLCVGYNFGSYQLWRVDLLSLDYSSPYKAGSLPVSHFCHLEPENDPRCFSYLWVAKCSSLASAASLSDSMQDEMVGCMATVSLIQLSYEQKTLTDQGGALFKDLMQVGCVLEHQLAAGDDPCNSWVVSCDTLANVRSLKTVEDDSQLGAGGSDSYLSLISWRVRYMDNSISSHLAVFDINRWYTAQMPRKIRWNDGWCPYFSQYRFDDAVATKPCLDLHIDTSSVTCYKCPQLRKLERFQNPSSLGFEVKLLLVDGVASVQYYGEQRQSLYDVVNSSTQCLVEPQNAFQLLRSSGLITINSANKEVQRKCILSTALLHTHVEYIIKCMHEFSLSDSGPISMQFLMSWLWEHQEKIIHQFDKNCEGLYDWSASSMDTRGRHTLLSSLVQTKNIILILEHLLSLRHQLKIEGLTEKLMVSQTRVMHMKLVWWCVNRGLLPETGENVSSSCFSYPSTTLKRSYNSRHSELLASASSDGSQLMIDVLTSGMGTQLRAVIEQEGGNGTYPPPNIKALLDVFLIDCDLSSKLLYFTYTMLDLMSLVDNTLNESLSTHMHSLLSCLQPGRDYSHLASVALALWHLDHREYQDLLTAVKQPGVNKWLTPHLHEQMLKRLLAQGQSKVALSMTSISSVVNENSLSSHLIASIYLANGMLSEAIKQCRACDDNTESFTKLLKAFKSRREMSSLLCHKLTDEEMECVKKELGDQGELDKLVIHYLQIGNLEEAVQLNNTLNTQPLWKGDMKAKERALTRDRLVKWQLNLLPPIQRKLLEDSHYLNMRPGGKKKRPKETRRSFFFKKPDLRVLAPADIANVMIDARGSVEPKPFIHSLTSSLRKSSLAASARRDKAGRSITGLFDSPSLFNRSPSKRRGSSLVEVSAKRSNSDESLMSWSAVKSLLQTPLVNRKSGLSKLNSSRVTTPHSILKVRKPHIVSSPSSVSGRLTPTLKFGMSPDEIKDSAARSTTRVQFDVQVGENEEGNGSPTVLPRSIDFTDDEMANDRSISDFELVEQTAAGCQRVDSEIEFNFDSPASQVMSAKNTGAAKEDGDDNSSVEDESFVSLPNESSPLVTPADTPTQEVQQSSSELREDIEPSVVPATVEPSPTAMDTADSSPRKVSADVSKSSLNDSLRSLSSLDDEAKLQGLKLRDVREAVMNRDSAYDFSPLTHAAPSDAIASDPVASHDFSFSTPTAPRHTRVTRSSSKASAKASLAQSVTSVDQSDASTVEAHAQDATAGGQLASKGKTTPHKTSDQHAEVEVATAELKSLQTLKEKTPLRSRKVSASEEVKAEAVELRSHTKEKTTPTKVAEKSVKGVESSRPAKQVETKTKSQQSIPSEDDQIKVVKGKKTPRGDKASQDSTIADEPSQQIEKQKTTPTRTVRTRRSIAIAKELNEPAVEKIIPPGTDDTSHSEKTNRQGDEKRTTPSKAARTRRSIASTQLADQPMDTESGYVFSPLTTVAPRDASVDVKESESFSFAPPSRASQRRVTRSSLSRSTVVDAQREQLAGSKQSDGEMTSIAVEPVGATPASITMEKIAASKKVEKNPTSKQVEMTLEPKQAETTPVFTEKDKTRASKQMKTTLASNEMKTTLASNQMELTMESKQVEATPSSMQMETTCEPKLVGSPDSGGTRNIPALERLETELEQKFEFSPVTTVASALTSVEEIATKSYTFTTPLPAHTRGLRSTRSSIKKLVEAAPMLTMMDQETGRTSSRKSRKKSLKPFEIQLPSDESSQSTSTSRYRRDRSSLTKKRQSRPIVIPLSEKIFSNESAAVEPLFAASTAVTAASDDTAEALDSAKQKEGSVLDTKADETILAGNVRKSRRISARKLSSRTDSMGEPSYDIASKEAATSSTAQEVAAHSSQQEVASNSIPKEVISKQRKPRTASASSEISSAEEKEPIAGVSTGRRGRGRSTAALPPIDEDTSLRHTQSSPVAEKAPTVSARRTRRSSVASQESEEAAGDTKPTRSRARSATPDVKASSTERGTRQRSVGPRAMSAEPVVESESSNRRSRLRSATPEVTTKDTVEKSAKQKSAKMTRLRSTEAETNRLRVDFRMQTTRESPSKSKTHTKMSVKVKSSGSPTVPGDKVTLGQPVATTSSARRGRPRKHDTQSTSKSSSKSVKTSKVERKSSVRTRSSVKKPDVSPILPPPTERITRVRRKL